MEVSNEREFESTGHTLAMILLILSLFWLSIPAEGTRRTVFLGPK
jgi:hypothetical protein